MDRFVEDSQRAPSCRRALLACALGLMLTTAGVFWLGPLVAPDWPAPIVALVGAAAATLLCTPLLGYALCRSTSVAASPELRRAERIVRNATEGILTINKRGQILSLNPAAERFFGYSAAEVLDEPVTKLLAEPPARERPNLLRDTMAMGTILGLAAGAREVIGKRKDGETFPLELTGGTMMLDGESVSIAFARDVSKRKRAQRYLTAHYAATCILAEAESLAEALPRILQSICEALCWEAGAYWRVDADAGLLRCDAIHQSALVAQPVVAFADLTCQPTQGLVGRIWSTGGPLWAEDVRTAVECPSMALAESLNLRGSFGFPIRIGQEVCGVMTFFSTRRQKQDDQLLEVMSELAKQLGHFMARKWDDEMLKQSEQRFRQLAENIHEVFWMADAHDDRVLYLSPSYEEVWGRAGTGCQKQAQVFLDFVHEQDRAHVQTLWQKQKQGENTSEEYRIVRPDGSVRWVWDRAFPIRDDAGQTYRVAGITRDITERRRTEDALRETTQTLQALVQAAPVAITIVDLAGKVRMWNPAAERIFGWAETDVLSRPLPLIEEGNRESWHGSGAPILQGRTNQAQPVRCRRKDGTVLEVSLSSAPLRDATGTVFGAMGILLDLTEQKQLESQLRQAQKMEAVGQLAGGVAHDFNNLLTIITGYSEMLLRNPTGTAPSQDFLLEIQKAGNRAASLTRQLLAFGRKQTLQVQVLDLNAVVENLAKMLRRLIGEDIEMVVRPEPLLGQVQADPGQIEQILLNLAANARDAMPEGGTLTIATANLERIVPAQDGSPLPVELADSPCVMIAVSDTGCGMDEATKARVFEPFFTTKEIGKGTGLGLATVYGIVKQSNGHIELDSAPGRGSTFRIYLPRLTSAHRETRDQQVPVEPVRGKETVLLVEDEDNVRHVVNHALQLNGYTVLQARSGHEALKLCAHHQGEIDLLVTDVIMPQMNGRQVAEQATSLRENLKVLYISGYTDRVLDHQGVLAPGTAFLHKPISPRVLAQKVREVLDGHPIAAAADKRC